MYEIIIKSEFASAHNLRNYNGICEALHGHNWKVDVVVETEGLDDTGLAIDFNVLKAKTNVIIEELDHIYLNEFEAFKVENPSSENIAKYFYDRLQADLGDVATVKKITIWETDDSAASYYEN